MLLTKIKSAGRQSDDRQGAEAGGTVFEDAVALAECRVEALADREGIISYDDSLRRRDRKLCESVKSMERY